MCVAREYSRYVNVDIDVVVVDGARELADFLRKISPADCHSTSLLKFRFSSAFLLPSTSMQVYKRFSASSRSAALTQATPGKSQVGMYSMISSSSSGGSFPRSL